MLSHVIAVVAGGASGLGAATASTLIRHGARVLVADLPRQKDSFLRLAAVAGAEAAIATPDGNSKVLAFAETDVTDESQVNNALDKVEEHFGSPGEVELPPVETEGTLDLIRALSSSQ